MLSAVAFAVALGFGIVAPAIPLFAKHFGVGNTQAGAVVSVVRADAAGLRPRSPGGWSTALGERVVLATGIGIVGVSSLLAGFSQTLPAAARAARRRRRRLGDVHRRRVQPAAAGGRARPARPVVERVPGRLPDGWHHRPAVRRRRSTAWSLRAPFFLYAATLLLAGTIAMVYLATRGCASARSRPAPTHAPTPFLAALRRPAYRAALANAFANGWSVFGLRSSVVPLFVAESLLLSPEWTGARPVRLGGGRGRRAAHGRPAGRRSAAAAVPARRCRAVRARRHHPRLQRERGAVPARDGPVRRCVRAAVDLRRRPSSAT